MVPKVLILNTGERIISGVSEIMDEEAGKGIGLALKCPYILGMSPAGDVDEEGNPTEYKVNFTKWFAYSVDVDFKIPYSSVTAIGDPEPGILNIYLEKFGAMLLYNGESDNGESNTIDTVEESGVSDSTD
jgi:hypothetical protein